MPEVKRIAAFIEKHFEEVIGCLCLSVIATCVFLEAVLRYGFDTGLTWTEEVAGFCMVWMVYMGASLAVRERFHIRLLAGVMVLPIPLRTFFVVTSDLGWLGFNLFMIWFGVEYLQVSWKHVAISPALGINEFWPKTIVVIGYGLMTMRLIQIYYNWFRAGCQEVPGMPIEYRSEPETAEDIG